MKTHKKITRNKRGFTLLEIMVVITIIGLIAALWVKNSGGNAPKGRATANFAALNQLQDAVDLFINQYGAIPTSAWGSGAGGAVMTHDEKVALLECVGGVYTGSVTGLAAYSQANPTYKLRTDVNEQANRFTALVVNSVTAPQVVILQYRAENTGLIINADRTIANSFIPDGSTITAPLLFDATANSVWTSVGKAAFPFDS